MMKTLIQVQLDVDLKNNFEKICENLNITVEEVVTLLAKKIVHERKLPFDTAVDPFYTEENQQRLRHSIAQMENLNHI